MIGNLDRLVDDVGALHSKLILLIAAQGEFALAALSELGCRRDTQVLRVGAELGARLAACPVKQRALATPTLLRDLADQHTAKNLLLLGNIELLFDRTLQLDPLDLLKQLARSRRVLAVWPGELRDGRLIYGEIGHPEHQDYGIEGLVPFEIQ